MKQLLLFLLTLALYNTGFTQMKTPPAADLQAVDPVPALALPAPETTAAAAPRDKEPIAVMDLKAEEVSQTVANILSNKLRTELFNSGKYNVLNREDMKAILGEQEFQMSGMCDDMKCMAKIGGALGVVYMVTGSIGKLGETYNLSLKMVDIEKIVNVNMVDETYSGPEDGLFISVQNAGRKLIGRTDLLEYKSVKAAESPTTNPAADRLQLMQEIKMKTAARATGDTSAAPATMPDRRRKK
jgi:TolB-like protein